MAERSEKQDVSKGFQPENREQISLKAGYQPQNADILNMVAKPVEEPQSPPPTPSEQKDSE